MNETTVFVISVKRILNSNGTIIPETQRYLEYAVDIFELEVAPYFTRNIEFAVEFQTAESAEKYWELQKEILIPIINEYYNPESVCVRKRVIRTSECIEKKIRIKEN